MAQISQAQAALRQTLLGTAFSPRAPITEESLFAGRRNQFTTLLGAVRERGAHALIYGERGVGKTSLANVLKSTVVIQPESATVAVRVACDSTDDYSSVISRVFSELALVTDVPATVPSSRPGAGHSPVSVARSLGAVATRSNIVVIVDEFDQITTPADQQLFADTIKACSDDSLTVTFILVGVADTVDDLLTGHPSVERALCQVKMPRMSMDELKEIVDTGLERAQMQATDRAADRIAKLSQGLPHYAHLLGQNSAFAALQRLDDEVNPQYVDAAMNETVQRAPQSIINSYHSATRSVRPDALFRHVLLAAALVPVDDLGYFAAGDLREPLRRITGRDIGIPNFSQHLDDFSSDVRGNILQRTGGTRRGLFRFVNPLLRPYVIMKGLSDGLISPEDIPTVGT